LKLVVLQKAYETLKDPDKREEYDAKLEKTRENSDFDLTDDNDQDLINDRFYIFMSKIVFQII
jgi:curved DNA-binding protein CbpA